MPISQRERFLALDTALGADVLGVESVTIEESISRPFLIEADLSSEKGEVDFDKVLGNNVTLRLQIGQRGTRYFNGVVSRFRQTANAGGYARYRAEIVPWLWFLTRTSDCRIFQQLTVPEIIQEVFRAHGFADFKLKLSETYNPREYCVQYRETDFNFVSRLMEEEGIFYFFEHENGKHNLVLADANSALTASPSYETLIFSALEAGAEQREVVTDWIVEREVQPGSYALTDYNFEKPKTSLAATATKSRNHGGAAFELFDYPGEYSVVAEGDRRAQVRLDELQARHETARAETNIRGVAAGSTFKLKDHPRNDQNREYLVTHVSMQVDAGGYASGRSSGEFFTCAFTCAPSEQTFRPPRVTPKPVVQGPQTAMVAGPRGREIFVDKYGRVKVQFYWDRYGKADENSSCYIRVSQSWAGKNWGAIFTPRIGHEVVVEFLEGDPDRPLITGSIYNDAVMPPYPLPEKKFVSTVKSNSTEGGSGFNEIRLDDEKGKEQIFVHAEKQIDVRVKTDSLEWVGNNAHLVVENERFEHIEKHRHELVDEDHYEKIGGNRHLKVEGMEAKEVMKSLSLKVSGDVAEVFEKSHSEEVANDYYIKAKNIVIEASTNITLKVGGSTIAIEAGGIGIKTSGQLKIESTGPGAIKATAPLTLESSAKADLKSPMTSVNGDGMVIVKGGLVKIN